MSDENKVQLELEINPSSTKSAFKKVEAQASESGSKIESSLSSSFSGIRDSVLNLKTAIIAAVGAIGAGTLIKSAVDEAVQAENAQNKLAMAFYNTGQRAVDSLNDFKPYADQLEKLVNIDNDVISENAALLVSLGKLSGQGLKDATKASIELSTGLGIGLEEAFTMVGKAASGSTTAFTRYGIKVNETLPASQKFASLLEQLKLKFDGMAEIKATSFEGTLTRMKMSFDNLLEAIGKIIINSPGVREAMKYIISAIESLTTTLDKMGKKGDPVGDLLKKFISLAQVINTYVVKPTEIFVNLLVVGFKSIVVIFDGIIALAAKFNAALIDYIVNPLTDFITNKLAKFAEFFNLTSLSEKIKAFGSETTAMFQKTSDQSDTYTKNFEDAFNSMADSADTAFNSRISNNIGNFLTGLQQAVASAKPVIEEFSNDIKKLGDTTWTYSVLDGVNDVISGFRIAAKEAAGNRDAMSSAFIQVGKSALTGLAGATSSSFAAFGKAMQQGEDATQAFANSFLSSIGGMFVQLGNAFILKGIAESADLMTLGAGAPLIAAGAALAVFGGVMQGMGGGSTSTSTSSSSSSPSGTTDTGTTDTITTTTTTTSSEDLTTPTPTVSVNVSGNILDRRESGLEIAQIIQETFSSQGLSLNANGSYS